MDQPIESRRSVIGAPALPVRLPASDSLHRSQPPAGCGTVGH